MSTVSQFLQTVVDHPWLEVLGWTLVHFLWQGIVVAIIVASALKMLRSHSAHSRYLTGVIGLAVLAILPLATGAFLVTCPGTESRLGNFPVQTQLSNSLINSDETTGASQTAWQAQFPVNGNNWIANQQPKNTVPAENQNVADSVNAQLQWRDRFEQAARGLLPLLPWLVLFWCLGVVMLAARLLIGLSRVRRWRAAAMPWSSAEVDLIVKRLVARIKPNLALQVLQSSQVAVPAVIGFFKPAVLVPTSMVTGLTLTELESILAHEIAHIRRHDWLVNLMQSMIETVLFYHPAVWWISRQVRIEREHCCDDIAVAVCGNPVQYARALARIEELRGREPNLAVAATGGSLLQRIQRIVGKPAATRSTLWPAGVFALLLVTSLAIGISVTSAYSSVPLGKSTQEPQRLAESKFESDSLLNVLAPIADDGPIVTKKAEQIATDNKTGRPARVLPNIRLEVGTRDNLRTAEVGLKYSNLFSYTLIPARVAEQLQAVTLGEIDFGEQPPAPQTVELLKLQQLFGTNQQQQETLLPQIPLPAKRVNFYVHEVSQPLAAGEQFVPYDHDAVWIPGHLGFYDMNQKQQRKFRVVRIDKVSLGIGPAFGPINALVLDDENSDFGVLGNDWVQQVRGQQGEVLFFSAADSAFFLMSPPEQFRASAPPPDLAVHDGGQMSVESHSNRAVVKRTDQAGVRLVASHLYDLSNRQSKNYIKVQDQSYPVDVGVSASGVWVGMTLMYDLVAIDEKSGEVLWFVEWQKAHPFWNTISIVEMMNQVGQTEFVVETFAGEGKSGQPAYQYLTLHTGKQLPPPTAARTPAQSNVEIPLTIVEKDNDTTRRAVISAQPQGRTARDLWSQWQAEPEFNSRRPNSITDSETLVSANPGRHIGNAVDAKMIVFNLPEGSGLRAEFWGDRVELGESEQGPIVTVTNGRVELIDAGGVIRAWASPDGGAEVLIAHYEEQAGERILKLTAGRLKPDPDDDNLIVQCIVNPDTGAPDNEVQSPHGAVRFDLPGKIGSPEFRFRISWRYDVERIGQEAENMADKESTENDPPIVNLRVGRLQHVVGNVPLFLLGDDEHVQPASINAAIIDWWAKQGISRPLDPATIRVNIQVDRQIPWEWPMRLVKPLFDTGFKNIVFNLESELGNLLPGNQSDLVAKDLLNKRQLNYAEFQQLVESLPGEESAGPATTPLNPNVDDEKTWGALAFESGIRSRLTLQTEQPRIGEPLLLKLEVKNFGEKPASIDPQKYAPFRVLQVEYVGKPGRKPFIGMTPQTTGQSIELRPGEGHVLWEKVDLNDYYLMNDTEPVEIFAEGGEWAFQAIWQDSNRITIQLPPGELTRRQQLIADLLAATPEDWKVSTGFGDIFLSHSPTNLKSDVTSIQLVFRDETATADLIDRFQSRNMPVARLGTTVFGEALLITSENAEKLWPEFQQTLHRILTKFRYQARDDKAIQGELETDPNRPWQATGRVTDIQGQPIVGAVVRAHCGVGSLHETGNATTDELGNYVLHFGPGIFSNNQQLVQAATISVKLDGFFEKNLGRQGDMVAALEKPERIEWGDRTEEHLFLPGKPRQIDFVLAPAVSFSGRVLVGDTLQPVKDHSVSLTGKFLPPSTSVVAQTKTDEQGKFSFTNLPTGYAFQLKIESADREQRHNTFASPPLTFLARKFPEFSAVQYSTDQGMLPYHFRDLQINLRGKGKNWREALSTQESKRLILQGDGVFSKEYFQSELVTLELGTDE